MTRFASFIISTLSMAITFVAMSEIFSLAQKVWGWSDDYTHLIVTVLVVVSKILDAALVQVAHYYNPDGTRSA